MAFFDKLNKVAKNLGDKTSDAIETTKLNTKIHSERNAVEEELKKIGEYYYKVYANGGMVAEEVLEFCQAAKAHYDAIEAAQAGIDGIKAENAAQPAPTPESAPVNVPTSDGNVCTACGAVNEDGTKFCFECGNKLEAPIPAPAPAATFCTNCGNKIEEGLKFCGECGSRIE